MSKFFISTVIILFTMNTVFAQSENLKILHQKTQVQLEQLVAKSRGAMGLSAFDLTSGERFDINEKLIFPQASAIKIAILMEIHKQVGEGKFKMTDLRHVAKANKVGGSGILAELGELDLSIHDLCILMIVLSDNTATNYLIDLAGMENINKTLASLGLKETKVQRRMIDTAASLRGDENLSTTAEAARIMEILFKGEFINRATCDQILAILKKSKKTAIQSGLPEDVQIASKPGGIAGVSTEWAIVYLKERPYVLVVMENYGAGEAAETTKEISKTLYEYFLRLSKATSHGTYIEKSK